MRLKACPKFHSTVRQWVRQWVSSGHCPEATAAIDWLIKSANRFGFCLHSRGFHYMLNGCVTCGRVKDGIACFDGMIANYFDFCVPFLYGLFNGLARRNMTKEARDLYSKMDISTQLDAAAYSCAVGAISKQSDSLAASELLMEMKEKRWVPYECTFASSNTACIKQLNRIEALRLKDGMILCRRPMNVVVSAPSMFSKVIRGGFSASGMNGLPPFSFSRLTSRTFCSHSSSSDNNGNGFDRIKELIKESWKIDDFESVSDGVSKEDGGELGIQGNFSLKQNFFETTQMDADRVFDVLRQDGPGVNVKSSMDELNLRISGLLVRQVLLKILRIINYANKTRCAKLAYKFFVWSSEQKNYRHTVNAYHLILKIFAAAEEFKAMWRLVEEMTEKGYPTTARTFNILICTCREAGLQKKVVERFIKSKTFNYRPFKHSYNAILLCLLKIDQYKLIEWVYQQMLADDHSPDLLTYNILLCAKYRLGKMEHFHRLLDEMGRNGFSPDTHTFNILLHVLGKGDKPLAALNLMNHMKEVGLSPSALHFTTLIDGLSRSRNLDACKYFFDEMVKNGCRADVVCYTVMVTGYVEAGELEKALKLFDDMIADGQLPNVFTYNSIIRGLCVAEKFEEACSSLKEMEKRGCTPNFLVYNTLISNLQSAGKLSEAHEVIKDMMEKGQYVNLISRFKRYRKC